MNRWIIPPVIIPLAIVIAVGLITFLRAYG